MTRVLIMPIAVRAVLTVSTVFNVVAVPFLTAVLYLAGMTAVLVGATRLTGVVDVLLAVRLVLSLGRRAVFHNVASSDHVETYTPHRYGRNPASIRIIPAAGKKVTSLHRGACAAPASERV
jgi:hypothetical protein